MLVPCVAPKFVPVIVTDAPTAPEVGDRLVMLGDETTVNATPFVANPPTVTTTFPLVVPVGTCTTIDVVLQLAGVAPTPLNVTVLVPWVAPKPDPAIVIVVPTAPDMGDRLAMLGITVKFTPLLGTPLTMATILPVVASLGRGVTIEVSDHVVGVAVALLNRRVLLPWVEPKLLPAIVTCTPATPLPGFTLLIAGATVVKGSWLLATPFWSTSTTPDMDPFGTVKADDLGIAPAGDRGCTQAPDCTTPVPWALPKPDPLPVTCVTPGTPVAEV